MSQDASLPTDAVPVEIIDRLRRIEGQVRGLQRMVQQQRSAQDVIYQMAAVKSALEQAALRYLWWKSQKHSTQQEGLHVVRENLELLAKML